MGYEYLLGLSIPFIVWLVFFFLRKDLRRAMLWTGIFYIIFHVLLFLVWFILPPFVFVGEPTYSTYWHPQTLFNLGELTGNISIEDLLFMFIIGGIGAATYELFLRKKISLRKSYRPHFLALSVCFVLYFLLARVLPMNVLYAYIFATFCGALVLWIQRKDLLMHSLSGGGIFVLFYFLAFLTFNFLFPDFIAKFYYLSHLSGILILGVPLEELLYALSFGLLWAPLYEYAHGTR